MKKVILVFMICSSVLLLTGCNKKGVKTVTCNLEKDITEGVKVKSVYKIDYIDKYVDHVTVKEVLATDSKEVLDQYEEQLNKAFSEYRKLKGYNNTIEKTEKEIINKTDIDYANIDMDKLIEIDSTLADYVEEGKIKLESIKKAYEQVGATCNK